MADTLRLSRSRLESFLTCRRQFQLRYLKRLPWPPLPLPEPLETGLARGQQFHQLLERHFLGLPVRSASIADEKVADWWRAFEKHGPTLPNGRLLPEINLTVPVSEHLLIGRFDLLIVGEVSGAPFAHIFDWKTGRPQSEAELRRAWQTRLYLALLAVGGHALWDDGRSLPPEQITLTYWYVTEPEKPRIIRYGQAAHKENWAELTAVVADIEEEILHSEWPLTDDWSHCRLCAYQTYCGRQEAGTATLTLETEPPEPPPEPEWALEPYSP